MALFAGDEWVEALKGEVNSHLEMLEAGKGFDATIQFVIDDAGGRGDLRFWTRLKDGRAIEAHTGEKDERDYTVSGRYAVWRDMIEGGEDPLRAIMTKKLTVEGNMQAIMKYIKAVNLMMECVQKIPTEF